MRGPVKIAKAIFSLSATSTCNQKSSEFLIVGASVTCSRANALLGLFRRLYVKVRGRMFLSLCGL